MSPKLSVVMSAYNAADHICDAVDSVLGQTMSDFELIIIDDGSNDSTPTLLKNYNDTRIKIITQTNKGLVASLNTGIAIARSSFIARHDADDRSMPERFEKQLASFVADPFLVLVGSSMGVMDMQGKYLHDHLLLLMDPELKQELLVRSPFAHGSVMFTKKVFDRAGCYKQSEWPAEDYGLWLRMAAYGRFANIDEPLYMYRENQHGISTIHAPIQTKQTIIIRNNAWQLRSRLVPWRISGSIYTGRKMEHHRLDRLARNLLLVGIKAFKQLDLITITKTLWLLCGNLILLRKSVRILLIHLRLKHG